MHVKKGSLQRRILFPLLFVIILEGILIYIVIFASGAMNNLRENAFDIFQEKADGRKETLENQMVNKWGHVYEDGETMEETIQNHLEENHITVEELSRSEKYTREVLADLADDLFDLLRKNTVTGAFVILDEDGQEKKNGVYFRDSNPYASMENNSDLIALRGPSYVTKEKEIALASYWLPSFETEEDKEEWAFYYKPFRAAEEYPQLDVSDLGYWCQPFFLPEDESGEIITYSIPLRIGREVVGVAGVEISVNYLKKNLPNSELNADESASYALLLGESATENVVDTDYRLIFGSGSLRGISQLERISLEKEGDLEKKHFYLAGGTKDEVYIWANHLKLYNRNTPFEQERWALSGVIPKKRLLQFYFSFQRTILYILIGNILIGIFAAILVAKAVSRPITCLTKKLKNSGMGQTIHLDATNIEEVDELTSTIEKLSAEVTENASKMATIIRMANVGIGICEFTDSQPDKVYCAGDFCSSLNIPWPEEKGEYLPRELLEDAKRRLENSVVERDAEKNSYTLEVPGDGKRKWIRVQVIRKNDRMIGITTDITKEMDEKKKIEYDRDYDLLTNLYNRRAFNNKMQEIFRAPQSIGIGAMVMLDLDNLKYINDTYGHDCGDEYIHMAAKVLRHYRNSTSVVARLSGDEFMAFFFGEREKDQIRGRLEDMFEEFKNTMISLPDGSKMPIRASAGISWYPDDGRDYLELVRYADFAMYKVKKTNKGHLVEFSFESYSKEAYLLQCKEELNLILDQELVEYMFQPIVDARTGEIFAYEALMRPSTENIKTPTELLALARSQSKLQQVERLTMFKSMEAFTKTGLVNKEVKIFINSIANQRMTPEEGREFEKRYGKYMKRVVIEFTEEEHEEKDRLKKKQEMILNWGAQIALDDFGEGYSNDSRLLKLEPDYVKIDYSLITGIHQDARKRSLVKNILRFTKYHGIKVVAEGVECREELRELIRQGVDYIQGFYTGRPSYSPGKISEEVKREIEKYAKDVRKTGL